MNYNDLRAIDVSQYIEKKGKLDYISWANAIDHLLQKDPSAYWSFEKETVYPDGSMMVGCNLFAFDKHIVMQLPVMTNNNSPVFNPNAFQINTAMMRCLTKAIACTGIGLLQLYAQEELPVDESEIDQFIKAIEDSATLEELLSAFTVAHNATKKDVEANKLIMKAKNDRKEKLK